MRKAPSKALPIVDGRRFGCTQCGNCCMQPGYVYMTVEELAKIAAHLGLTPAKMKRKYKLELERSTGEWYIDAMDGKGCPLLTEDRRCSVHPVKPSQCGTFPFWTEMLAEEAKWESAKSFCPGLDAPQGQLYTAAQIEAIRAGFLST